MESIKKYLEYMNNYPSLFRQDEQLKIVSNPEILQNYAIETKQKIGIILENDYMTIASDLIEDREGNYYTYTRMLNIRPYAGVVIIPVIGTKIVLLNQFRHTTRKMELELPRGFAEEGLSIEENVKKELREELGVLANNITYIGSVLSDTGFQGGLVHILKCEVDTIGALEKREGIRGVEILTQEEVANKIRDNTIQDCFTISAFHKMINADNIIF